jgi:hypothetical protein
VGGRTSGAHPRGLRHRAMPTTTIERHKVYPEIGERETRRATTT